MRALVQGFLAVLSILVTILFVTAMPIAAQSSGAITGAITGTVKDQQQSILPGATVTIKEPATNFTITTTVDNNGVFRVLQLPPGKYSLQADAEGFVSAIESLTLTIGTTALVEFNLKVGETRDVVEVQAGNQLEGKTESSNNIERGSIDGLPINRRNFLDFAVTVPRVIPDRLPPNGTTATSGLSFSGQTARGNNITVDGFSNNDLPNGGVRSTFSQEAVQEFQIVSDSYSAEFGRAIGGVVNIVTRSGSNDLHGTIFNFFRNETLSARDVFVPFEPRFRQYQFGAAVSGPISKDRAFFFTSFERLSVKQNTIVTISDAVVASARRLGFPLANGARPFSVGFTSLLARGDFQLNSAHRLSTRFNGGYKYDGAFETISDAQGGLISDTAGGIQKLDDYTITGSDTYLNVRLNLVNELRVLYGRITQHALPVDADNPQVQLLAPEGRIFFGRNVVLPQPTDGRVFQLVDNISLLRGRHQLRFGGDFFYANTIGDATDLRLLKGGLAIVSPIDFAQSSGIPGLPFFSGLESFDPTLRSPAQRGLLQLLATIFPQQVPGFPAGLPLADLPLPVAFVQGFGNGHAATQSKLFSLYFQDDLRLSSNLLIKAGLRYDINRITSIPDNSGNFSPRVALAYRFQKLPGLQLRAAYGIFFGAPLSGNGVTANLFENGFKIAVLPFPLSVVPFSLPGRHYPEADQLPAEIPFIPQLSQEFRFQPDYRNSYSHQASLGFSYLFNENTELAVSYNFLRGLKLANIRNINPIVRPVINDQVASAFGRNDSTRGDINEIESAFDSYYHSVTLAINRRLTNGFSYLASYTFSKAIDNVADGIRPDIQPPNDPLRPGNERGLSLQDLRHRFVASGVWQLNQSNNPFLRDFQISTIITLETGRPYDLLSGQDLNGDTLIDRPTGLGRNLGVTPGFASVNLRLARAFTIKESYRMQLLFEVFNLFNRVNISQVNNIFPPDAQGNFPLPPRENGRFITTRENFRNAFAPRQCQVGVRFNF